MKSSAAALYCRSSKDRSDVSIDAQRRELLALAASRSLPVVAEYADAVESAKDDNRPGFQSLLLDLRAPGRRWDHLLLVDTSRLSRRRYLAQAFKHEAKKRGVVVLYARVPETDPITAVILESVFEAMDEVHSLMSREKGLAGMRENVLRGWRAGGRAPIGYQLRAIETGAQRDGAPVRKSVLEPGPDAARIRRYLKARATGTPQAQAAEALGLPRSSCNGIEWNALTYAGATVWNVHAEPGSGPRRRPREEWVVQPATHPALITQAEAEAILEQLGSRRRARRTPARFLLTGVLATPAGAAWHGDTDARTGARQYRVRAAQGRRSRSVSADDVEAAVLAQVTADLRADGFAAALVDAARAAAPSPVAGDLARKQIAAIEAKVRRMMALAAQLEDPAPALREVDALERERRAAEATASDAIAQAEIAAAIAAITPAQAQAVLVEIAERLEGDAREAVKDALAAIVERVELDPETLAAVVVYRAVTRDKVASPRGFESNPCIRRPLAFTPRRRRA